MLPENPLKAVKAAASLAGEVMRMAGENPNARAAGDELGKTALTISKTINNALLPLAAVNFAFDKARAYFADRFQSDLSAKLRNLPPENLTEPRPSIAGPALQGLAFSHEEPDLKELYLSLLASAMDNRVPSRAHPAFVEIIRQLESEEARLIRTILSRVGIFPIVEVRLQDATPGWNVLLRHLMDLQNSGSPKENPRLPAMVDNWARLGLIEIAYDQHLMEANAYTWVDARPEVVRLRRDHETETEKVYCQNGVLWRTALGEQFAMAVGLLPESSGASPEPNPETSSPRPD